jgi:hypothetical protein
MRPVLRRIAISGGLTALVLGIIGFMFAELATMWLTASLSGRGAANQPPPDASVLRFRLPLMMAGMGFTLVAVGELILHRVRKNRPPPAPTANERENTEKLLQQLLAEADAKRANSTPPVAQNTANPENNANPAPPSKPAEGKG